MGTRPTLLFYCQHSLGMGHLVRSLALAGGLGEQFRVVFLNGGPLPRGARPCAGVEIVALPPIGLTPDGQLISHDRRRTVEQAQSRRRELLLEVYHGLRPQALLIELFPFGRKKFRGELLPLLEAARGDPARPLVLCSLRDILVGRQHDQQAYDDRASALANSYFDAILVHADPRFVRLEETFRPSTPLRVPVHYTGFVLADTPAVRATRRTRPIVVSAGGGLVGEPLLRTAAAAQALLWPEDRTPMTLVAGPFLPEDAWRSLRAARRQPGLSLRRSVPDLRAELRGAVASISQCGYNTALEVVQSGVPALVVPYSAGQEDEQMRRARRLERLGAVRVLEPRDLDVETLAAEIRALRDFRPRAVDLNLDGVHNTTNLVGALLQASVPQLAALALGVRP
jgi:predicted glycosyltransferase